MNAYAQPSIPYIELGEINCLLSGFPDTLFFPALTTTPVKRYKNDKGKCWMMKQERMLLGQDRATERKCEQAVSQSEACVFLSTWEVRSCAS